jgi:hypothetical protein
MTFLPRKLSKKTLVASATMFGSICIWDYGIHSGVDQEEVTEFREVLQEFTGHQGVIFNVRWMDDRML